jgi:hypothetical protein
MVNKNKDLEYKAFNKDSDFQFDNMLDKKFRQDLNISKTKKDYEINGNPAIYIDNDDILHTVKQDESGKILPSTKIEPEDIPKNAVAVDAKGKPNTEAQKKLAKNIKKKPEDLGKLYQDLKDVLKDNTLPTKINPTKNTRSGFQYFLKNGGIIYLYEKTNGKYMIGFDMKSKQIVDDKNLINKYNLEVVTDEDENESPE